MYRLRLAVTLAALATNVISGQFTCPKPLSTGDWMYCTKKSLQKLANVADISCGGYACVARKNDGTALAWGRFDNGGNVGSVDLTNVADISCGGYACVARKNDGTAVAWGSFANGGNVGSVDLTNVADISCGSYACVARKNDGTAVAWGTAGGDASSVDLTNVATVSCGGVACVALKNDGTAVAWGNANYGGNPGSLDLTNVADISCGGYACVARKNDGTAVAWGRSADGGNAGSLDLTNVADISCGERACVARKNDGTAVVWGKWNNVCAGGKCVVEECCSNGGGNSDNGDAGGNNNNGDAGGNNNNGDAGGNNNNGDAGGNSNNGDADKSTGIIRTVRQTEFRKKCHAGGCCHTYCMSDGGDKVCEEEDKKVVQAACSKLISNDDYREPSYKCDKKRDPFLHDCPFCNAEDSDCIRMKVQFCEQACMNTAPVPKCTTPLSDDASYRCLNLGNCRYRGNVNTFKLESDRCPSIERDTSNGGGLLDCKSQVPDWLPYGRKDTYTKGRGCHPSDSIVNVKRSWGGIVAVTMANLKIGDVVESKHGTYEPIIAFSHRDYEHTAEYFQISAGNHTLDISDGHYMYLHDKETLVQPRDVQIGDRLSTGEIVSSIQKIEKIGLIHPHTWSSTLVVNGVQTSTNTEYIDLVVQDFVTVPLMYLAYLLRMPADFCPGSRMWKAEQAVIMTRDLQNMLRDVSPKVLYPFLAVPFVVAILMYGFPEHAAVVCVLVFLNLASTKTARSKLSKKQSMLSCGAMGFLVVSLLLHSANAACSDFTTEASVQDSSCQTCTGTACSSATCTPGYHTYGRDTETCQACTSMSNAAAVTCTERWSSFIVACEEGFTRISSEYEYKDNTTNTMIRGTGTACVLPAIIAEREALEKEWESKSSSSNVDTGGFSGAMTTLFFAMIGVVPVVFCCVYLYFHWQQKKKERKAKAKENNETGTSITVEVELQSNPMKK